MSEFEKYIAEAVRVRRAIQIYHEFFDSEESIEVLSSKGIEVVKVIQRSMHDEIVISLARMFDSDAYHTGEESLEYLSQRNLALKYSEHIDDNMESLRQVTSDIWSELKIKNYKDVCLSHNDKNTMLDSEPHIRHGLDYSKAVELVESSIKFICVLKVAVENSSSISVNVNEKYEYKGFRFIDKIST